ncbi:MAG: type IV pilus assembly protein PilM [Planctomycetota bacterium]
MFGLGRREIMGVDIGSSVVKVVQLRQSHRGWIVTGAGISDISDKGSDSPGRQDANTLRAILNCVRLSGIRANLAVCGVGGPDVVVRNFEFPAVPAEEIERAVRLEARQVCPFNTDEIAVDYRLMPGGNKKTKGYLVVATDKLVNSKTRLVKKARLDCALMDIDGLALLNCFKELENPSDKHGTALLNIGSSHTTLAIEGKNGWPLIRNLNYAGDSIIRKVAAENELSQEDVKAILAGDPQEVHADVRQSFESACDRLVADITKTVRYYGAQGQSSEIKKILVCGGFALFGELVKILDSRLPMKVATWNPFEKMRCQVGRHHRGVLVKNILRKNGPAMAVAAGFAMRSI